MIIRATIVPDLALPLATLLPHSVGPYLALVAIGFVVAIVGHLGGLRWLIVAGIVLIFVSPAQ